MSNKPISDRSCETIVALASGALPSGIAVVRVSGATVPEIAQRLTGILPTPRQASLLNLRDREDLVLDQAIVIYYPAPHSYTGEAVLEIQVHGSAPVVSALIDLVCSFGARHARPGEFTERAYFNNRIDLVQAEAVADLINAQTLRAARAAHHSLRGGYSRHIQALQDKLTTVRVRIEANLDFPEEELHGDQRSDCERAIANISAELGNISRQTELAITAHQSLRVVLIGEPNVGKSTLINALSGEDLAIVSNTPGTTRDAINANISVMGRLVTIVDTAGIRNSGGEIELEGMRRAQDLAGKADRIWWIRLLDNGGLFESSAELKQWLDLDNDIPVDTIYNKIDLGTEAARIQSQGDGYAVWLAGKTGMGLEHLHTMVEQIHQSAHMDGEPESEYSARRRHADALDQVHACLQRASALNSADGDWELIAEELRLAQTGLDSVLGAVSSDDLLGEIFSQFCIGK